MGQRERWARIKRKTGRAATKKRFRGEEMLGQRVKDGVG